MATIVLQDTVVSTSITTTDPTIGVADLSIVGLYDSLKQVNTIMPIESLMFVTDTVTLTLKDLRSCSVILIGGMQPTFKFTSTNFWDVQEFSLISALLLICTGLVLQRGMTAMAITYA
jgi:hypothetical protein